MTNSLVERCMDTVWKGMQGFHASLCPLTLHEPPCALQRLPRGRFHFNINMIVVWSTMQKSEWTQKARSKANRLSGNHSEAFPSDCSWLHCATFLFPGSPCSMGNS